MTRGLLLELTHRLDRFTLAVRWETAESALGIFGPSGAGKTTILESVAGLRSAARGIIRINGRTWLDSRRGLRLPPEQRGVGYVPQDALLFPHRNVLENVTSGRRRAERVAGSRVTPERVLEVLELADLAGRPVGTLSGGERQRVALGRALCSAPDLLLLDEPLASLDLPLRRRIGSYLFRIREEFAIPTLHVSHDATEIKTLSREVLVLASGRVMACGPAETVFTDPSILPMTETTGLDNVVRGTVVSLFDSIATVELAPGLRVEVAAADLTPGEEVVLAVRADDMIVATQRPAGLSAQNALEGSVHEIREESGQEQTQGPLLVSVTVGELKTPLVAAITRQAGQRLALRPGTPVFLVSKAHSFKVLASR